MLTGKEKVALALSHQAGPVPVDFGGTATTGIHASIVRQLRAYYGLEKKPVMIAEPLQMLGVIEDDLACAIGVDTRQVPGIKDIFGIEDTNHKEWRAPWGDVVLVPGDFHAIDRNDGYLYLYPCGDLNAAPCAKMPTDGLFFDTLIRQPPLDEESLRVEDNLEEFAPIQEADLAYYADAIARMRNDSRAVIASFGGTALGDIALVPGSMLRQPKGIRDIEEWYVSTIARPDFVREIFDRQTLLAIENLKKIHAVVGDAVQVAYVCGTDLGTQHGPFCSPEQFRSLYMPYYQRVNDWIHANTQWKTFKHCCGSIQPLIEGLIESGFDILNPVQWSARNMDAEVLKKRFGDRIVFWGGGVNTQTTLPFGTPSEVRKEVLSVCETFSANGGFVFNAIHNIQAKTPIENVVAVFDAVREFNKRWA